MKKIILILLALIPHLAFSQWVDIANQVVSDEPFGHRVWSIKMIDENTIWMVSSPDSFSPDSTFVSVIYRSIDGGETFESFTIPGTETLPFYDISGINDQTAYVASFEGIYQTIDGGQTWNKLETCPLPLTAVVHAFNENDILVAGADEEEYGFAVSTDGGLTWTLIGGTDWVTPPSTSLWELDPDTFMSWAIYSNNATYDIVGDAVMFGNNKGQYILSTDKGYNWEIYDTPFTENGIASSNISMVSPDTFMMASDLDSNFNTLSPVSIATTDGGATWIDGFPPVTLADVQDFPNHPGTFIAVSHAAFSGAIGTAITYDFGNTWEMLTFDPPLISMDFLNDSVGIATCCNISVLNAFGGIYQWNFDFPVATFDIEKGISSLEIGPNPFSKELQFKTDATQNLEIIITDINGKTWLQFQTNGTTDFSKNMDNLPKGMYLVRVYDGANWFTDKLIKQ